MGAKTGTGTYGQEIYEKYNLPDNAAKDVWINGFSQNILCRYGWASIRLNNMEQIHLSVIQNKSIHNTCMKM